MGTQPRYRGLAVVVLLAAGLALAGPIAAADGPSPAAASPDAPGDGADAVRAPGSELSPSAVQSAEQPPVTIAVQLAANGSARWNVSARFDLDSANETRAFDQLAQEFEAGEGGPGFSLATFEALAEDAGERTGRDMAIQAAEREATRHGSETDGTGVLSLRFTWTNFTRAVDGQLVVGDVFEAWELTDTQRLVVYPPTGYGLQSAQPGTDGVQEGGPVWNGPQTFSAGEPSITYDVGVAPSTTTTGSTTSVGPPAERLQIVPIALGVGAVALLAVLVVVLYRRDRWPFAGGGGARAEDGTTGDPAGAGDPAGRSGGDGHETGGDAETADGPGDARPAGGDGETGDAAGADAGASVEDDVGDATDAAAAGAGAAGSTGAGETGEEDGAEDGTDAAGGVDPDLLSDEERVEHLLEQNDGRMRQADIVTETGWSNAKVSQLLSTMDEEDRVEKLRMGRENLISLPEYTDDE